MAELKTLSPRKWVANYSGAAPTLDASDDVYVGDLAVDSSNNAIWQCFDRTEGAPVWTLVTYGGEVSDAAWTGSNWNSTTVAPSQHATEHALLTRGMWTLVQRQTVAGSAVTSLTFSGLNGNTARRYKIVSKVISNSASANLVCVTCNTDTTASNYPWRNISSVGAAAGANTGTNAGIVVAYTAAAADVSYGEQVLDAATGAYRSALGSFYRGATSPTEQYQWITMWLDNSSNITQLVVTAAVASGLGIGSYVELWKLAQ